MRQRIVEFSNAIASVELSGLHAIAAGEPVVGDAQDGAQPSASGVGEP